MRAKRAAIIGSCSAVLALAIVSVVGAPKLAEAQTRFRLRGRSNISAACEWVRPGTPYALPRASLDIDPVRAPRRRVRLPARRRATVVSNTAELFQAVAAAQAGAPNHIRLLPGTYACPNPGQPQAKRFLKLGPRYTDWGGAVAQWLQPVEIHLWAAGVTGSVVLKFGVQMRERKGGLHGLAFDIDDPSCAAGVVDVYATAPDPSDPTKEIVVYEDGVPLHRDVKFDAVIGVQRTRGFTHATCYRGDAADAAWPTGGEGLNFGWDDCAESMQSEVVLEDLYIDGGQVVTAGIRSTAASRNVMRRIRITDTLHYGLRIEGVQTPEMKVAAEDLGVFVPPRIRDIVVRRVADPSLRKRVCSGIDQSYVDDPNNGIPPCTVATNDRGEVLDYFPGRKEIGVVIGVTSDVRRVKVRDVAGHGFAIDSRKRDPSLPLGYYRSPRARSPTRLEAPSARPLAVAHDVNATIASDISVDRLGPSARGVPGNPHTNAVGIYFERVSKDAIVQDFCVGPSTHRGAQVEYHQSDSFFFDANDGKTFYDCISASPISPPFGYDASICVKNAKLHAQRAERVTLRRGLIDSARPTDTFLHGVSDCNVIANPQGVCEQAEATFVQRFNSVGVVTGRHTEAMRIERVLIRNSGCSALYLQDAYDWPGSTPYRDCPGDLGLPWPNAGNSLLPLGCSPVSTSPWYSPWCPALSGNTTANLESGACVILQEPSVCGYTPLNPAVFDNRGNGSPNLTSPFICTPL